MKYSAGYKYQLEQNEVYETGWTLAGPVSNKWMDITVTGRFTIYHGYAWDGPSGPTIDTKDFMRGSLFHDGGYQLMGEKKLDEKVFKEPVDRLLQKICIEDGMSSFRAWYVYLAVHLFGGNAAEQPDKPPLEAP